MLQGPSGMSRHGSTFCSCQVLVVMTLPVATHAVKLNLPQAAPRVPPPAIRLDIRRGGDIYWDGTYVGSLENLSPRLRELAARRNPPLLQVMPERRASCEHVAQVLAAAQRPRVGKLSVAPVPD